jgi:hypothetical protein
MSRASSDPVILAIDQGTTNSKAALISADGRLVARGSAPVGVSSPQPGWVEQDANRIWTSVLQALAACVAVASETEIVGVALSTQRESVVGWRASNGAPLGPVIGWQDRRTASWCKQALSEQDGRLVKERTGLRIDPMFSAPKMRWLLDNALTEVPIEDIRLGTVDAWLVWQLTGGAEHLCEAGNASRTLLYDVIVRRHDVGLEFRAARCLRRPIRRVTRRCCLRQRLWDHERRPAGSRRHTDCRSAGRFACRIIWPRLHGARNGESHIWHRIIGHGTGARPLGRRCQNPGDIGVGDRRDTDVRARGEHSVLRSHAGLGGRSAY